MMRKQNGGKDHKYNNSIDETQTTKQTRYFLRKLVRKLDILFNIGNIGSCTRSYLFR